MSKADEFYARGDVDRARKHWEFAVNDVARQALQLKPPFDGPKGNVQIWTEGIIDMQRIAQDRCFLLTTFALTIRCPDCAVSREGFVHDSRHPQCACLTS